MINENDTNPPLSIKEIIEIKEIFTDFLIKLKGKIEDNISNYEQKEQYKEILNFFDCFFNERVARCDFERISLTNFCFEFREKWPKINILLSLWFKIKIYFDNEILKNYQDKDVKTKKNNLDEFEGVQFSSQVKNQVKNYQIESRIFGYSMENFDECFGYSLKNYFFNKDLEKENHELKSRVSFLEEKLRFELVRNEITEENQFSDRTENNHLILEVDSLKGLINELNKQINELEIQLSKYKELIYENENNSLDKSKKIRNNFKNLQKIFLKIENEENDKYRDQCQFLEGALRELLKRQKKTENENKELENRLIKLNKKLEIFKTRNFDGKLDQSILID